MANEAATTEMNVKQEATSKTEEPASEVTTT